MFFLLKPLKTPLTRGFFKGEWESELFISSYKLDVYIVNEFLR